MLKCLVFLTDISKFQEMNEVYHTFFPTELSARSTVAGKTCRAMEPRKQKHDRRLPRTVEDIERQMSQH